MRSNRYNAFDEKLKETVTLIDLDDDEWFEFIKRLVGSDIQCGSAKSRVSYSEVEQIDINFCAPFCTNSEFFRIYEANTKYLSVISGELGKLSLRLWLGENGIRSSLMEIQESLSKYEVFSKWWRAIPLEPQIIDDTIMTKRTQEYGINHVQLWLKSLEKGKPTSAIDRFSHEVKLWVQAHELFMDWEDRKLYQR